MIVDTDVLIDYLRGREPIRTQLQEAIDQRLRTTVINQFELLAGARQAGHLPAVQNLIELLEIVPLDSEAADIAGRIRRELAGAGRDIGMADCLIAGIALNNDEPLLTRNRKHFERVANLKLVV